MGRISLLVLAIALLGSSCERLRTSSVRSTIQPSVTSSIPANGSSSQSSQPKPSVDEGEAIAQAPVDQPSSLPTSCTSAQTQAEMTTCAGQQAELEDEQLNKVYQQLKSELTNSQREELLIDAQLAWINFRDANCTFSKSKYEGGSIAPMDYSSCIARMTKQRTDELRTFLDTETNL